MLATLIWGSTFVAQEIGGNALGSFNFLTIRCFLAVFALLLVLLLTKRKEFLKIVTDPKLWKAGIPCGVALFAATALQQFGLTNGTTAGKSGFITTTYIILVPLFSLILKKKPPKTIGISVAVAAVGLYMISGARFDHIALGDLLTMGCAVAFAIQILIMDRVAGQLNSIALNMSQALVCAVCAGICALIFNKQDVGLFLEYWLPLCWAGVLSMGIAYTLQIVGQKSIEPNTASLLMSFEAVFAALSGLLAVRFGWLEEAQFSWIEGIGCALLFAAILISQIPTKKTTK